MHGHLTCPERFWHVSDTRIGTISNPVTPVGDLPRYVLDHLFDKLTDKSYWNVDDQNNADMLRIIAREAKSKFQLTIGVFSIVFVMSVIEKLTEFLNTLTMKYELQNKCGINTFNDSICASLSLEIILLPEYYYVPIRNIKLCFWNLDLKWKHYIFLQSRWECHTQWSQHGRPVVLKWMHTKLHSCNIIHKMPRCLQL